MIFILMWLVMNSSFFTLLSRLLTQSKPTPWHRVTVVAVVRISGFCLNFYMGSWNKDWLFCNVPFFFFIKSNNSTLFSRVVLLDSYSWVPPGLPHDWTSDEKQFIYLSKKSGQGCCATSFLTGLKFDICVFRWHISSDWCTKLVFLQRDHVSAAPFPSPLYTSTDSAGYSKDINMKMFTTDFL